MAPRKTVKYNINENVVIFKAICEDLYSSSHIAKRMGREKGYVRVVSLVMETKYGLNITECTLEEIGYVYGFTRERTRQIEMQALKKTKVPSIVGANNIKRLKDISSFMSRQPTKESKYCKYIADQRNNGQTHCYMAMK